MARRRAKSSEPRDTKVDGTEEILGDESPRSTSPIPGSARNMDGAQYMQVHRTQLLNAQYNPRVMDDYAKIGLRESIKKTGGLIETPVWNKRTGNLVAGHQRLEQTDALAKGTNYQVTVAVIDVDEKTERELNVRLNNHTIRGMYDIDGIQELLEDGADYQNMGFDVVSLEALFMDAGKELDLSILGGVDSTGLTKTDDGAARDSANEIASVLSEADRAKQLEAEEEKIREIKQRKKDYIENMKFKVQSGLAVTLVFPTNELKAEFMKFLQFPEEQERVDGIAVCRFLDLDIPEIAKAGGWEPGKTGSESQARDSETDTTSATLGDDGQQSLLANGTAIGEDDI